nr:reverse transcriptase domain-containing protein [Tanacetum cinerariifolium]
MRPRSSGLVVKPSTTPRRRCNKKRSQQQVDSTIVEKLVVTMADQHTIAELLQAPTEGYGDAIVILAENFELKHGLLNLVTSKQFCGFEKEDPQSHIHLVYKFINQFFPPSKTTNLQNEITNFQQGFDESFCEAWEHFKDLLRACPHHSFTELHQIDTFYNSLTSADQDSLNAAAGGNLLTTTPKDALTLIENKLKVRTLRNGLVVAKVSTNTSTSGLSPDVAALTDAVKDLLLKNTTLPPASVKAVEKSCVTCGGPHPYYQYVVPTSRVVVPTGKYVVPAGNVIIVSSGRLSLIPTGRVHSPGDLNVNSLKRTRRDRDGRVIILPPMTADEHITVQRESKARTTLLQSIPDDHVADFHYMDDVRDIWNAVKVRFGGNAESKKIRKSMLKQEFLEFRIALTLKTKGGLKPLSFDDLYYKLKTLEVDVKGYTTFYSSQSVGPSHSAFICTTSASKKMSYGDSPSYSSTTTYTAPSNSKTGCHRSGNVIKDVLQSFVADTKLEQQLAYEYFKQIEKIDLEEIDMKWQMAMLSVRVHKFEQKAGRKIDFDKKESAGFNKKKVRCYKCQQRGHFSRECKAKGGNDKQRYSSFKIKEIGKKEEDLKALITIDTDGVIASKEFGMIAGCDTVDAIKEGVAKIYNLITRADTEEASTAGDAGEFALMGVIYEVRVLFLAIPLLTRKVTQKQSLPEVVSLTMDLRFLLLPRWWNESPSFLDALLYMPKFASTFKILLSNKEKLFELVNTPMNENCSWVILKKLLEKLRDPDKFLIPCNFPEIVECLALTDLELTLRVSDKAITFKVGNTSRFSYNDAESINQIDVIDVAYEEYSQEVLGFSSNFKSGNPTLTSEPNIVKSSPPLTLFEGGDFILEENAAYLTSDSVPLGIDDAEFDPEGDIRLIKEILNNDPHTLRSL